MATKPRLILMLCPMAVMKEPLTKRHRAVQPLVNIHQAKTHLSQLLQEVEQGQETAAAAIGGAGAGAAGGDFREPGNVMGDGDQGVDRVAAGGSAGTGAPDAVAGLPLAANQQRLLAAAALETDGVHRDPLDRLLVSQSRVEPGKVMS